MMKRREDSSYRNVIVYDAPNERQLGRRMRWFPPQQYMHDETTHRQAEWQRSSSSSAYDTNSYYTTTPQRTPSYASRAHTWRQHQEWNDDRRSTWDTVDDEWNDAYDWDETSNPYTWERQQEVQWDRYNPLQSRATSSQYPVKGKGKGKRSRGDARDEYN